MQSTLNNATRYIFSDLVLDVQRGTLSRNGEVIALPKLSYDLLVALVQAAPALISQQQLMDSVWPERVIGDETLKQRIKLLRKSLNDDATSPVYIEAVRGRGYRLIPSVKPECIVQRPPSVMLDITASDLMSNILASNVSSMWRKIAQIGAVFFIVLLAWLLSKDTLEGNQAEEQTKLVSPTSNANDNAAHSLYKRGMDYYRRYREPDTKIAINFFNQALAIDPRYSDAYAGLSQAYSQLYFQFGGTEQDKMQAIEYAYLAISYNADSAEAYKALGSAYYVSGWLAKSITILLRATQKEPINKDILSNLAFVFSEHGNFQQALYWHKQALKVAPNDAVVSLHTGITLENIGYHDLAQRWYQRALTNQPDYMLARYYLAQSYCLNNQIELGLDFVNKSLLQFPQEYWLGLAKAHCLYHQGDKNLAFAVYQQIIGKQESRQHASIELDLLNVNRPHTLSDIERYELLLSKGSDKSLHAANLALLYNAIQKSDKALRFLVQTFEQAGRLPDELLKHDFDNNVVGSDIYQQLLLRHQNAMASYQQLDVSFFQQF